MPLFGSDDRDRRGGSLFLRGGLIAGCLALLLVLFGPLFPTAIERVYSRGIYPPLATLMASLTGWLPFSLAELTFLALGLWVLLCLRLGWSRSRRDHRGVITSALRALGGGIAALGWIWALFLLLWGTNYLRLRPLQLFELGPRPSAGRIVYWRDEIGARLDQLREGLEEDRRGVVLMPSDLRELDGRIRVLQRGVLEQMGLPPVDAGHAKRFLISPLLLRWGVSGTYGPFTGEPNVVRPAPPGLLPAIVAHERAHLSGFGWEEAASFVGLRTLWASDDPQLRYSAWLSLMLELRPTVKGRTPAVQRDLRAIASFARRHRGWEAPAVRRTYSAYLETHGVKGGTASYGRVADLALRWLEQTEGPAPGPPETDVVPPPDAGERGRR